MRIVPIENLSGDEVLARSIYDITGRVILSKGIRIKLNYINKLVERDIPYVYIEDEISEGIEIDTVICDETRIMANQIVQQEMNRFLKSKEINTVELDKMNSIIVNDVLSNKNALLNIKDIKLKDEYTFTHSVNVSILSVFLAAKLGFTESKIRSIGLGALLHDFGKMLIPDEILNKPSSLDREEYEEIRKHPLYGYNSIKDDHNISATTKVTILFHHERLDGSGYPLGIKGEKINDSAKICAICDVFDAMTSNRVYRNAIGTSDAIEFLYTTSGIYFEKEYVDTFLKYVPIYTEGSLVLLSNNLVGIVIKNNIENLTRPQLRILFNKDTKIKYERDYVIDLMKELTLKIVQEISISSKDLKNMNIL